MSADVINFADHKRPTANEVDEAWDAYAELAGQVVGNPRLVADRRWYEEFTLRHDRFQRLFLRFHKEAK